MRIIVSLTALLVVWLCRAANAVTTEQTTAGNTKVIENAFPDKFLYVEEPHITEYQGDEVTDFRESRMPRIVQFYSPYCVSIVLLSNFRLTVRQVVWILNFLISRAFD